jgi:DNA-binding transcriptional regulator PaaX
MLTETILEIISDFKWMTTNVFFTDYNTSYKNLRKAMAYGIDSVNEKTEKEIDRENRQKFYNLLGHLQKQGFIQKRKNENEKTFWKITKKGMDYLGVSKAKNKLLVPIKAGAKEKDSLKVIVFDIPESHKKERNWLRKTLVNLEFKMLQKSVWTGEIKLPKNFFVRLKNLKLLNYVHIFEVNKKGTIGL